MFYIILIPIWIEIEIEILTLILILTGLVPIQIEILSCVTATNRLVLQSPRVIDPFSAIGYHRQNNCCINPDYTDYVEHGIGDGDGDVDAQEPGDLCN